MDVRVVEGIDIFGYLKYFNPDLEFYTFLVATYQVILFLLFLGIRSYGVTLARVCPVNPELTDTSVRSLSTTITSGTVASY